jgi:tRNA (mo5U34)-methyltransferase
VPASSSQALVDRVSRVSWYHSLPLPGGIVTPGSFDTPDELARVPFPESLAGTRCLDVATADGFWAFEMERRGAAEVVATDIRPERLDWPAHSRPKLRTHNGWAPERGFDIAHEAFKSQVLWREQSVYDLAPESIGEFDFIFVGSLLGHVRDPVAALAAISSVLRGELLSVDFISAPLTLRHPRVPVAHLEAEGWPLWWVPNLQAYRQLFGAAKLDIIESGRPFFVKRGRGYSGAYDQEDLVARQGRLTRTRHAITRRLGNLHGWVRARRSAPPADRIDIG